MNKHQPPLKVFIHEVTDLCVCQEQVEKSWALMLHNIPLMDVDRGVVQDGQLDGAGFPLVTSFFIAEKSIL